MPEPRRRSTRSPLDAVLGARLKEARIKAGLSQEALARRVGLSGQQIQKYEAGVDRVAAITLCRIAVTINAPLTDLLGGLGGVAIPSPDGRVEGARFPGPPSVASLPND